MSTLSKILAYNERLKTVIRDVASALTEEAGLPCSVSDLQEMLKGNVKQLREGLRSLGDSPEAYWTEHEAQLEAVGCCQLFGIPKDRAAQLIEWTEAHRHPNSNQGAIGGAWTYSFTPTSLGHVIVVRCNCGGEIDLSGYDDW